MTEPKTIHAGSSYSWSKSLSDYPASDGWTLKYSIVNCDNQFDVTAVANGDDYDVTIATTDSAEYVEGAYKFVGYVEKAGERVQVYGADLVIRPDFTNAADMRSYAERVLEAVEAVIEGTASKDQQSVMIDGQTLVRRPVADLITLRDRFKREVESERRAQDAASGVGGSGRVQLRFK